MTRSNLGIRVRPVVVSGVSRITTGLFYAQARRKEDLPISAAFSTAKRHSKRAKGHVLQRARFDPYGEHRAAHGYG